jgi:hypothetical protein
MGGDPHSQERDLCERPPTRPPGCIPQGELRLLDTHPGGLRPYFNRPDLLKKFQGLSHTSFSMFFSSAPRERSSVTT